MQRTVAGRDGVVLQVRADPGTDADVVRQVARDVAQRLPPLNSTSVLFSRMSTAWDPALYLDFDDHRSRPFHDLLARVGAAAPRRVVDLGCGPGHLTGVLAARWPKAAVSALDSSAEMVAAARERGIAAEQADVRDWTPPPDADVVVTNAVLQWVPGHLDLLPALAGRAAAARLVRAAGAGQLRRPVARAGARAGRGPRHAAGRGGGARAGRLRGGARGAAAPTSTSGRRPTTSGSPDPTRCCTGSAPPPCARCATPSRPTSTRPSVAELAPRLRAAYPARPDGTTWFPFRRIFAVARTR